MKKSIIIKCPMALPLFMNLETIKPEIKSKIIEQTVELNYTLETDILEITDNDNDKIEIAELNDKEKEIILKTITLFEKIAKIKINGLKIKIHRINLRLSSLDSIIAGLLIGLNEYYQTNLDNNYLKKIAFEISPLVSYFLIGGFKKISEEKREITSLPKNPYRSYLIVDKNENLTIPDSEIIKYGIVSKDYRKYFPYTDYEKVEKFDYSDIKIFLKDYPDTISSPLGNTTLYLITSKNEALLSQIKFRLQKKFPNYKVYFLFNTEKHKVLIKHS